ncbi:hypothetical protein EDD15DRAFT_2299580 [Pisolithus albus]|nr:hypothetical protein EDD15DRAFT_2299580 [Pisolithus albus]
MRTTIAIFYALLIIVQASDLAQSACRSALLSVGVQKETRNLLSSGKPYQSARAPVIPWYTCGGMVLQRLLAWDYGLLIRVAVRLVSSVEMKLSMA